MLRFDGKGPNAERQDHCPSFRPSLRVELTRDRSLRSPSSIRREPSKSTSLNCGADVRAQPTGKLAFVCDLGADVVRVFQAGAEGVLAEVEPAKLPPGSGPRHLDFYVDKVHGTTYVYVISELNNTLTTMTLDYNTPRLTSHQTVSILADNVKDPTTWGGSEVVVSPDGRFVYAGNRQTAPDAPEDDNTVAVLRRNDQDGRLSDKRVQPLGGRLPRHFALDPSGRYLVVGAQGSDRVLVHERDEQTGQIRELARTTLPKPAVQIFA